MFGIKVKITKFIDGSQPGWVECEFTDAFGNLHIFKEKVPIVTEEYLDENSIYPQDGIVACEIIERKNIDAQDVIKVNSELPWHIESINSETIFEVLPNQIVEFEHSSRSAEKDFIPFGNYMVHIDYHFQNLYDAFNKRDVETILSMMDENVKWANGMEGGFVFGRENVREYWRRQFELVNPQLEPFAFKTDAENREVVTLRQIVRDLDGNVLDDKTVEHISRLKTVLLKLLKSEIPNKLWKLI